MPNPIISNPENQERFAALTTRKEVFKAAVRENLLTRENMNTQLAQIMDGFAQYAKDLLEAANGSSNEEDKAAAKANFAKELAEQVLEAVNRQNFISTVNRYLSADPMSPEKGRFLAEAQAQMTAYLEIPILKEINNALHAALGAAKTQLEGLRNSPQQQSPGQSFGAITELTLQLTRARAELEQAQAERAAASVANKANLIRKAREFSKALTEINSSIESVDHEPLDGLKGQFGAFLNPERGSAAENNIHIFIATLEQDGANVLELSDIFEKHIKPRTENLLKTAAATIAGQFEKIAQENVALVGAFEQLQDQIQEAQDALAVMTRRAEAAEAQRDVLVGERDALARENEDLQRQLGELRDAQAALLARAVDAEAVSARTAQQLQQAQEDLEAERVVRAAAVARAAEADGRAAEADGRARTAAEEAAAAALQAAKARAQLTRVLGIAENATDTDIEEATVRFAAVRDRDEASRDPQVARAQQEREDLAAQRLAALQDALRVVREAEAEALAALGEAQAAARRAQEERDEALREAQAARDEAIARAEAARAEAVAARDGAAALEEQLELLRAELEAANAEARDNAALRARIAGLEVELAAANLRADNAERQAREAQQRANDATARVVDLIHAVDPDAELREGATDEDIAAAVQAALAAAGERDNALEEAQARVTELEELLDTATAREAELNERIAALTAQLREARAAIDAGADENARTIEGLRAELADLQRQLAEETAAKEALTEELAAANRELAALRANNQRAMDALQAQLTAAENAARDARDALAAFLPDGHGLPQNATAEQIAEAVRAANEARDEELEQLRTENAALRGQNRELGVQNRALTDDMDALRLELDAARREAQQFRDALQALAAIVHGNHPDGFPDELLDPQGGVAQITPDNLAAVQQLFRDTIDNFNDGREDSLARIEELEQAAVRREADHRAAIEALEGQLRAANEALEAAQRGQAQAGVEKNCNAARIRDLEADVDRLRIELAASQAENQRLQAAHAAEVNRLTAANRALQVQVDEIVGLEGQIDALQAQVDGIADLRDQIGNLTIARDGALAQQRQAEEERARTQRELDEARAELERNRQEIAELRRDLAQLRAGSQDDRDAAGAAARVAEARIAELEAENRELEDRVAQLTDDLAASQEENERLTDEWAREVEERDETIAQLRGGLEALEAERDNIIRELQEEIDHLRAEAEDREKKIHQLELFIRDQGFHLQRTLGALEERRSIDGNLAEINEDLRRQVDRLTGQVDRLTDQVGRSGGRIGDLAGLGDLIRTRREPTGASGRDGRTGGRGRDGRGGGRGRDGRRGRDGAGGGGFGGGGFDSGDESENEDGLDGKRKKPPKRPGHPDAPKSEDEGNSSDSGNRGTRRSGNSLKRRGSSDDEPETETEDEGLDTTTQKKKGSSSSNNKKFSEALESVRQVMFNRIDEKEVRYSQPNPDAVDGSKELRTGALDLANTRKSDAERREGEKLSIAKSIGNLLTKFETFDNDPTRIMRSVYVEGVRKHLMTSASPQESVNAGFRDGKKDPNAAETAEMKSFILFAHYLAKTNGESAEIGCSEELVKKLTTRLDLPAGSDVDKGKRREIFEKAVDYIFSDENRVSEFRTFANGMREDAKRRFARDPEPHPISPSGAALDGAARGGGRGGRGGAAGGGAGGLTNQDV